MKKEYNLLYKQRVSDIVSDIYNPQQKSVGLTVTHTLWWDTNVDILTKALNNVDHGEMTQINIRLGFGSLCQKKLLIEAAAFL